MLLKDRWNGEKNVQRIFMVKYKLKFSLLYAWVLSMFDLCDKIEICWTDVSVYNKKIRSWFIL